MEDLEIRLNENEEMFLFYVYNPRLKENVLAIKFIQNGKKLFSTFLTQKKFQELKEFINTFEND